MRKLIAILMLAGVCCAQAGSHTDKVKAGVQSCARRGWPVGDATCHGYALVLAGWYYAEHKDEFQTSKQREAAQREKAQEWRPVTSTGFVTVPSPAKPLVCGKYQHVFHWPGPCGPTPCNENGCLAVCSPRPADTCVDDMHEVTEREWQETLKRIAELEKLAMAKQGDR